MYSIRVRLSTVLALLSIVGLLQASHQNSTTDLPLVITHLGQISGSILKTQNGANIFAFRGIRYAQPPVGDLRFKPPEPVLPWKGTLNATSDSLICPQHGAQELMSEDCLTLNVFSRNLTLKSPVMIYIHGGANVHGSGHSRYDAGPQYLLDHDVVLVAFNYRLGALGFLSTRTPEAPGNYGYLDQLLVLKWVQSHIDCFGGSRNSVTIFGQGAGAMAVTLHMASPLSEGLFHYAIAMSGSATNAFNIDNVHWTRKLARELSCPMYNPPDVVDCLRNVSWKTIATVSSKWELYAFTSMKWNYEIDGYFLEEHPTEVFEAQRFHQVPMVVGITKNELDFSVYHHENNSGLLHDISINFDLYAPEFFLFNRSAYPGASQRLRHFYLGDQTPIIKYNLNQFGEIFSDGIIGYGVHRLVELVSVSSPVYYYRMDYVGRRSLYSDEEGNPRGVGHADDIRYIMPRLWYGPQLKPDDPDMFMVTRMTNWWTSFATYGIPLNEFPRQWEPSTRNDIMTLYIDRDTTLDVSPNKRRYAIWNSIFSNSRKLRASAAMTLIGLQLSSVKVLL